MTAIIRIHKIDRLIIHSHSNTRTDIGVILILNNNKQMLQTSNEDYEDRLAAGREHQRRLIELLRESKQEDAHEQRDGSFRDVNSSTSSSTNDIFLSPEQNERVRHVQDNAQMSSARGTPVGRSASVVSGSGGIAGSATRDRMYTPPPSAERGMDERLRSDVSSTTRYEQQHHHQVTPSPPREQQQQQQQQQHEWVAQRTGASGRASVDSRVQRQQQPQQQQQQQDQWARQRTGASGRGSVDYRVHGQQQPQQQQQQRQDDLQNNHGDRFLGGLEQAPPQQQQQQQQQQPQFATDEELTEFALWRQQLALHKQRNQVPPHTEARAQAQALSNSQRSTRGPVKQSEGVYEIYQYSDDEDDTAGMLLINIFCMYVCMYVCMHSMLYV
jgi:hypothetical protein